MRRMRNADDRGGGHRACRDAHDVKTIRVTENFMDKKRLFHSGEVWLEALREFGDELHGHMEWAGEDRLRFQDGRLYGCLARRIKAGASGKGEWYGLFECYRWLMTEMSPGYGYDDVRRLHWGELKARELASAREYCSRPVESLDELMMRVRSIASWMECQEAFPLWLVFKDVRDAWKGVGRSVRRR
jgi:hypothetical protein